MGKFFYRWVSFANFIPELGQLQCFGINVIDQFSGTSFGE